MNTKRIAITAGIAVAVAAALTGCSSDSTDTADASSAASTSQTTAASPASETAPAAPTAEGELPVGAGGTSYSYVTSAISGVLATFPTPQECEAQAQAWNDERTRASQYDAFGEIRTHTADKTSREYFVCSMAASGPGMFAIVEYQDRYVPTGQ